MTCCKYEAEFERLLVHKKSAELLIERIFNEKKYPEFHQHLDHIHEAWIERMRKY